MLPIARLLVARYSFAALLTTFCVWCAAAELSSFGKGDFVVDACLFNTSRDNVRMFWRAPNSTVFGTFGRIQGTLEQSGEHLFCASNGGIYGKDLHPIGLYVENGTVMRRLNVRDDGYGNFYLQPNGVFALLDRGVAIWTTHYVSSAWDEISVSIKYATQSGPLMLQSGQINTVFTQGSANRLVRNAACTKGPTEAALVKSRMPINFFDFARILRDEVGCRDALYLDGSISELYPFDDRNLGPSFGVIIGVVAKGK